MSHRGVGEVKLCSNSREREHHDNMADFYAIIKTTEALEKAYLRDLISNEEYKSNCAKLLKQFKSAKTLCQITTPDQIRAFMKEYRLDCRAGYHRLVEEGIPESSMETDDSAKTVAETVQFFITAMDSLKLDMTAVDQIYPLLKDLYESLCKISRLSADWEGKIKIKHWLQVMNDMAAHEELDDEQVRQILFDLDSGYTAFHRSLTS